MDPLIVAFFLNGIVWKNGLYKSVLVVEISNQI